MHRPIALLLFTILSGHGQAAWQLLARDDGCVALEQLVRMERLPRTPVSPDDFAQMLRARGEQVTVGLPGGFPAEFAGKVVQVEYGPSRKPIFVSDDFCSKFDGGKP